MLSSVLGLALLGSLNPVRLGVTLLLISRQRPVRNLLLFWVGCLTGSCLAILFPLVLLNVIPALESHAHSWANPATNSSFGYVQVGLGVLALTIAALIAVRLR